MICRTVANAENVPIWNWFLQPAAGRTSAPVPVPPLDRGAPAGRWDFLKIYCGMKICWVSLDTNPRGSTHYDRLIRNGREKLPRGQQLEGIRGGRPNLLILVWVIYLIWGLFRVVGPDWPEQQQQEGAFPLIRPVSSHKFRCFLRRGRLRASFPSPLEQSPKCFLMRLAGTWEAFFFWANISD